MGELGKLAEALCKVQGAMGHAAKSAINPHFRSKYADFAGVVDACRQHLVDAGIAVVQPVACDGKKVVVSTILIHTSGESLSCSIAMEAKDAGPQAIGSCITYGRRYGLASMVGVATEDDDGEAAEKAPSPVREKPSQDELRLKALITAAQDVTALEALLKEIGKLDPETRVRLRVPYSKRQAQLVAEHVE